MINRLILFVFLVLVALTIASSCGSSKKLAKQHKDLNNVYETLKNEMPEALVTMEGEKVKVVLPESILFKVNEAEINREYIPILSKMAKILTKYDKTTMLITGYSDITGGETLNNELSKKRAENAKKVFIDNNVAAQRMPTWGRGAKDPIADNKTEAGRKQNRRVEFVIMYDYKPE